jgi:O-antigen ligase
MEECIQGPDLLSGMASSASLGDIGATRQMPWRILASLSDWNGYVLLFLMMVFPMVLRLLYWKAALFAGIIFFSACAIIGSLKLHINREVAFVTLTVAAAGMFFSLEGLILNAPGAMKQAQVFVFWPCIYLLWLSLTNSERYLTRVHWLMIFATAFLGAYGAWLTLDTFGMVPHSQFLSFLAFDERVGVTLTEGIPGMKYPGMNSLAYLLPFAVAGVISYPKRSRKLQALTWVAIISTVFVVIISGRRGTQLATIAGLFFAVVLWKIQPLSQRNESRKIIGWSMFAGILALVAIFLYVTLILRLDWFNIAQRVQAGFNFSGSTGLSAGARRDQFRELMGLWSERPLLGWGLGAQGHRVIRDPAMPWAYELSYVAMLFQAGIVGVLFYLAGILWIFWRGVQVIRSGGLPGRLMLPNLVGLFSYLIANATNPYFARFDGLWAVFVPIAIVNLWLSRCTLKGSIGS